MLSFAPKFTLGSATIPTPILSGRILLSPITSYLTSRRVTPYLSYPVCYAEIEKMKTPFAWPDLWGRPSATKKPGSQAECHYELRHTARDFASIRPIPVSTLYSGSARMLSYVDQCGAMWISFFLLRLILLLLPIYALPAPSPHRFR